jgi:hypothetical protein
MIVAPGNEQQKSEHASGNQNEESQGSGRHSFSVGRDIVDVKDQPSAADKHHGRPENQLAVRPPDRGI